MMDSKNANWDTSPPDAIKTWEMVQVDVLMDVREQLKKVGFRLDIVNRHLAAIRVNTSKKKRPKRKAVK